jgi:hypothetical protein
MALGNITKPHGGGRISIGLAAGHFRKIQRIAGRKQLGARRASVRFVGLRAVWGLNAVGPQVIRVHLHRGAVMKNMWFALLAASVMGVVLMSAALAAMVP